MANLLIVNYQEVTSESINDLISKVANAAMIIDWDFKNSQIKIKWRWEEEKQVEEFLSMLQVVLKEANIFMINEEKETTQEVTEETTILENENLQEKVEEEISTDEKINLEEESEAVKKEATSISNEEAFKKLLETKFSEYDFDSGVSLEVATRICSDFGIHGAAFYEVLKRSYDTKNEVELYKLAAQKLNKNVARVKLEALAALKRGLKKSYPDFEKRHPTIKVIDFLNIFKKDDVKK